MTLIPRPVRNNNPGDLETGAAWKGLMPVAQMTAEQASEPRFCVFISPAYGFRALAILLRNYKKIYGDGTVRTIIDRFAPPNENDTTAYIKNVCTALGVGPDTMLDLGSQTTLSELCKAVSVQEAGGWYFQEADLEQGVAWALT